MDATQTMIPPPTAQRAQALTPEQVWEATLNQLQLQMTKAEFDAKLKNAWFVEVDDNNRYIIGVANEYAQDWLENRLKGTVERTLSGIAGQETQVEFRVVGKPQKPVEISPDKQSQNGNNSPSAAQITAQADYQKGFFKKGGAGYSQLAHHTTYFWMPLLGPAFILWQYLSSQDKRPLSAIAPNYWSPPQKYSYRDLAQKLNRKHPRVISGDAIECAKSRELRKMGTPILRQGDCCKSPKYEHLRLKEHPKSQGFMCQHWSAGLLETLHKEGVVAIEMREINEQKMFLQVWRMLPILTPQQYARLNNALQNDYDQWLDAYGHHFGITDRRSWEASTEASIAPLMPGYDEQQIKDNFRSRKKWLRFIENAYRNETYKQVNFETKEDD